MSLKPKPCKYGCGQDVVLVTLNGTAWIPMSVVPVPLAQIHSDFPAVAWLRDGTMVDCRRADNPPRLAHPSHLCPTKPRRPDRLVRLSDGLEDFVYAYAASEPRAVDAPRRGRKGETA